MKMANRNETKRRKKNSPNAALVWTVRSARPTTTTKKIAYSHTECHWLRAHFYASIRRCTRHRHAANTDTHPDNVANKQFIMVFNYILLSYLIIHIHECRMDNSGAFIWVLHERCEQSKQLNGRTEKTELDLTHRRTIVCNCGRIDSAWSLPSVAKKRMWRNACGYRNPWIFSRRNSSKQRDKINNMRTLSGSNRCRAD